MLKRLMPAFLFVLLQVTLSEAGTLKGIVLSSENGQPVANINVVVIANGLGGATDDEGKFTILFIPPGVYDVQATGVGFKEQVKSGVAITEKDVTEVSFTIEPVFIQMKGVEIKGTEKKGSAERQIADRLSSSTISDAISGQAMKAMPNPDVAQVVARATGVSVMGGDPIIRGMGVRYSKVTLNDAQIAGTEPNRSGVSLDLFPSSMMQAIKVKKSFSADQFGEFGGGVIDMSTWDFAGKPELTVSYGVGMNSNTTFQRGRTYNGGSWDAIAIDDGSRDLPDLIKDTKAYMNSGRPPSGISQDSLLACAMALKNNWNPKSYTAPPNQNMSITYANHARLLGRDLNFFVSGLYKHSEMHRFEIDSSFQKANAAGKLRNEYWWEIDSWTRSAGLGLLTNLKYDITPLNSLNFNGMISHDVDDETRFYDSYNEDFGGGIKDQRFRFIVRNVSTGQLSGRHVVKALNNSIFSWQTTVSEGTRYEPDTREVQYRQREGRTNYEFSNDAMSGARFYYDLTETSTHFDVSWMLPVGNKKIKVGTALVNRHRDAPGRWLKMQVMGSTAAYIDMDNPEEIFDSTNIANGTVRLTELPRDNQNYHAFQYIRAVYVTSDIPITDKLKMVTGLRHESTTQTVTSTVPLILPPRSTVAHFGAGDFLPAFTLIYKLGEQSNLRLAVSQTISRPDFREMSKYEFNDVIGGYPVVGDTTLTRALIQNYDVRYETSSQRSSLFSVSLFYKNFYRPIETVLDLQQQNRKTFANAKGAEVAGMEVEVVEKLGQFWEKLEPWAVSTNFTLSYSRIHLSGTKARLQNQNRPLQGQSPYLFNFNLHYYQQIWKTEADLLFNVIGKRITEVGLVLPDIYELPHPTLDLSVQQPLGVNWTCKLGVSNILNPEHVEVQHDNDVDRDAKISSYHTGVGFTVGITYRR